MRRFSLSALFAATLCLVWALLSWAAREWFGLPLVTSYPDAFAAALAGYWSGSNPT